MSPASFLVVDDQEDVREFMRDVLMDEGYTVYEAVNGLEALATMRAVNVDVVITDLVMPVQEGIETIRLIQAKYPQCKIIAVSGAGRGVWLTAARLLGAQLTLTKPFSAAELVASAASVLNSSPENSAVQAAS